MRVKSLGAILVGTFLCLPLSAQTPPKTEAEINGRKMYEQRCSICHLPPPESTKTYGPMLSVDTVNGREAIVREVILKGTPRMPGFQYGLEPKVIDNIIAYLKTVKKTEPTKQQGGGGERVD